MLLKKSFDVVKIIERFRFDVSLSQNEKSIHEDSYLHRKLSTKFDRSKNEKFIEVNKYLHRKLFLYFYSFLISLLSTSKFSTKFYRCKNGKCIEVVSYLHRKHSTNFDRCKNENCIEVELPPSKAFSPFGLFFNLSNICKVPSM